MSATNASLGKHKMPTQKLLKQCNKVDDCNVADVTFNSPKRLKLNKEDAIVTDQHKFESTPLSNDVDEEIVDDPCEEVNDDNVVQNDLTLTELPNENKENTLDENNIHSDTTTISCSANKKELSSDDKNKLESTLLSNDVNEETVDDPCEEVNDDKIVQNDLTLTELPNKNKKNTLDKNNIDSDTTAISCSAGEKESSSDDTADSSKEDTPKQPFDRNKCWGSFLQAMDHRNFLQCDEKVAVIKEKQPKAKFHYLIIPHENIRSLSEVTKSHIEVLKYLEETAKKLLCEPKHQGMTFNMGYIGQPTMIILNQKFLWLHLHLISDDMKSDHLKLRKHWNSFHSKIFLDSSDVLQQLEKHGKIDLPTPEMCKSYLNGPMRCHKCKFDASQLRALKKHLKKHFK